MINLLQRKQAKGLGRRLAERARRRDRRKAARADLAQRFWKRLEQRRQWRDRVFASLWIHVVFRSNAVAAGYFKDAFVGEYLYSLDERSAVLAVEGFKRGPKMSPIPRVRPVFAITDCETGVALASVVYYPYRPFWQPLRPPMLLPVQRCNGEEGKAEHLFVSGWDAITGMGSLEQFLAGRSKDVCKEHAPKATKVASLPSRKTEPGSTSPHSMVSG